MEKNSSIEVPCSQMQQVDDHDESPWKPTMTSLPQVKPKVFNLESRAFRNIALPPLPSLSLTPPYLCIAPAHSRRKTLQQHSGICCMHTFLLWPLLFHFYFIWLVQLDKEFGILYYIQNIIFLISHKIIFLPLSVWYSAHHIILESSKQFITFKKKSSNGTKAVL